MFRNSSCLLVSNKCALSLVPRRAFGITPFYRNAAAATQTGPSDSSKSSSSGTGKSKTSYISPLLNVILFGSLTYIGYDYYNLLNIVSSKDLKIVAYTKEISKLNARIDKLVEDEIKFNKEQQEALKKIISDSQKVPVGGAKPSVPKIPSPPPIKKSKGWYQFW